MFSISQQNVKPGCATAYPYHATRAKDANMWNVIFRCNPCVREIFRTACSGADNSAPFISLVNNVLIAVKHSALMVHLLPESQPQTKSVYCFNTTVANNKVEANQSKETSGSLPCNWGSV